MFGMSATVLGNEMAGLHRFGNAKAFACSLVAAFAIASAWAAPARAQTYYYDDAVPLGPSQDPDNGWGSRIPITLNTENGDVQGYFSVIWSNIGNHRIDIWDIQGAYAGRFDIEDYQSSAVEAPQSAHVDVSFYIRGYEGRLGSPSIYVAYSYLANWGIGQWSWSTYTVNYVRHLMALQASAGGYCSWGCRDTPRRVDAVFVAKSPGSRGY